MTDTLDQQQAADTQAQQGDQQGDAQGEDQQQQDQQQDQQQGADQQKPKEAWYSDLPEDMKAHPKIQSYKTKADMVKGYLELQQLLGNEKVPIPKDEKDTLAQEHLNRALGVPETPEGYKLQQPEPIPGLEGLDIGVDEFQQTVHKYNLTPKQAQGLLTEYRNMLTQVREQSIEAHKQAVEAAKAELTKEWGMTFEPNVKLAQSVINKFTGSKEEFDHLNAALGHDPVALRFLAKVGGQFKEGTLGDISGQGTSFTKSPAEAKKEYDQIMSDFSDPYWSGVKKDAPRVPESVRQERISYVENLLRMSKAGGNA